MAARERGLPGLVGGRGSVQAGQVGAGGEREAGIFPRPAGKRLKFLAGGTTRWQLSCAFNLVNPQPARRPTRTKASLPPKGAWPAPWGLLCTSLLSAEGLVGGLQPQALPLQQRGSPLHPPSFAPTPSLTESDSLHPFREARGHPESKSQISTLNRRTF